MTVKIMIYDQAKLGRYRRLLLSHDTGN